jgi:threonine dehydratase
VVAVTSGANINFERLRLVAELANVGSLTEATMATTIPERPGAFSAFIDAAVGAGAEPLSVTEFKYRFSAGEAAQVLWGAGIRSPEQLTALLSRMNAAGFSTVDISKVRVRVSMHACMHGRAG